MNKALQRNGIKAVYIQAADTKSEHIIQDLKGKILFSHRNLSAVMKWLNQVSIPNIALVKAERPLSQSLDKPQSVRKSNTAIPFNKTKQYAEHHDHRLNYRKSVAKVAAHLRVEDAVAENVITILGDTPWEEITEEMAEAINEFLL